MASEKPSATESQNQSKRKKTFSESWRAYWHRPSNRLTLFIIGTNAVLAVATIGLYCATRDLVHDAENTARRQLRAYVLFDKGYIRASRGDTVGTRTITLEIKNFGNTPAYNVTTWWDSTMVEPDEPHIDGKLRFKETKPASVDLGPDGVLPLRKKISIADFETIQESDRFFVWGAIKFRDTFQRCHFVTFRLTTDVRDDPDEIRLIGAERGNAASDEPHIRPCKPENSPYGKSPYPAENEVTVQ